MLRRNRIAQNPIYDNCAIQAPDGQFLAYCRRKRFDWYLKQGLADQIDSNTIRLRFEPAGREGAEDPYHCTAKDNRCVVCGSFEELNRHHVVPYCFTKHMPRAFRENNCHDVLALCLDCHTRYEEASWSKREDFSRRYDVPLKIDFRCEEKIKQYRLQGWARVLTQRPIPPERRLQLLANIAEIIGREPTEQDLQEFLKLEPQAIPHRVKTFGERIVEKIENFNDFAIEWRQHFIDTMQPKYLDSCWKIDRVLKYETSQLDEPCTPHRSFTVFCKCLFAKYQRNLRLLFGRV